MPQEDAMTDEVSAAARDAGAVCAVAIVAVLAVGCWRYLPGMYAWLTDPAAVHAFVAEHAVLSRLALVGINAFQVVLAFLPGEPVELASGYAFGLVEGTVLCLIASAIASSAIYLAVRRWGWRLVGRFFDRAQLERYAWIRDTRRLELVMLAVFLIPGTPKDFLTYFAGLTKMRFGAVLAITTFGRLPSVVTSTVAASALVTGDYTLAIASVLVAGALLLAGGILYRRLERRAKK